MPLRTFADSVQSLLRGHAGAARPRVTLTLLAAGLVTALPLFSDKMVTRSTFVIGPLYGFNSTAYSPAGSNPSATPIIQYGNLLLGANSSGGANNDGTIYSLLPKAVQTKQVSATETTLLSFSGAAKDGERPSGLMLSGHSLYGVTACCGPDSEGVAFRLTAPATSTGKWKEQVLFPFSSANLAGGSSPTGKLAMNAAGDLFGAATYGGSGVGEGNGIVFELMPGSKLTSAWTEKVLYTFTGKPDGANPDAGVEFGSDGSLYGTTELGGSKNDGTVFRLTPPPTGKTAWTEHVLYSFPGGAGGKLPGDNNVTFWTGHLMGMTQEGGSGDNGVIYELSHSSTGKWNESVIYKFPLQCSYCTDYTTAAGGLTVAKSGAIWGTTEGGGKGYGSLFKLTPPSKPAGHWTTTTLWAFDDDHLGGTPNSGVTIDHAGNIITDASTYGPVRPNPGGVIDRLVP